jgi:cytidylate kinase
MKVLGSYEKARLYIETHSASEYDPIVQVRNINPGPCITLSRETGIGAERICELLIDYLVNHANHFYKNWAFFDKNLIEKVLADHELPSHFRLYLENERPSSIDTMFAEILHIHPSNLKLLHKTSQTILRLAKYGNVIIIGRGGNLITAELKNSFHVRLVAPEKFRVNNAMQLYDMDRRTASHFIEREDKARKEFLKKYFHRDIEDPKNYHLVLNTYLMSFEEVAETIGGIIIKKYPHAFAQKMEFSAEFNQ